MTKLLSVINIPSDLKHHSKLINYHLCIILKMEGYVLWFYNCMDDQQESFLVQCRSVLISCVLISLSSTNDRVKLERQDHDRVLKTLLCPHIVTKPNSSHQIHQSLHTKVKQRVQNRS